MPPGDAEEAKARHVGTRSPLARIKQTGRHDRGNSRRSRGDFVCQQSPDARTQQDERPTVIFRNDEISEQLDPVVVAHGTRVSTGGPTVERQIHRSDITSAFGDQRSKRPQRCAMPTSSVDHQDSSGRFWSRCSSDVDLVASPRPPRLFRRHICNSLPLGRQERSVRILSHRAILRPRLDDPAPVSHEPTPALPMANTAM